MKPRGSSDTLALLLIVLPLSLLLLATLAALR